MTISQNIFCSILLLIWCQLGETKNLPDVNVNVDVNVDLPGDGGSQNLDLCTALKRNESSNIDTLLSQTDLNQTEALVNAICDMTDGTTPLFIAIEMQNKNVVELLLSKNADANHVSDDTNDKMIPLQWAIQRTEKDVSIFLAVLNKTSDINYQDSMGNTSLHYLVKRRPQYSNIMVQQIYKKGARDIKNNEGKTAYDTAHGLEYVQMKEFVSWYADETNSDKKYGQFRKLAKTASEDLSKIQDYVNYIAFFPKFKYLATLDVQKAMAEYNTEESLELHDQNIHTAKEHANDWNVTIYPRIKDLYEDVGKFSTLFVQNYDKAESKIESLRQERLTDEEFEYDLAKNLKVLETMGMADSVIATAEQNYRREGKYRELDKLKRNKFYTEIVVFLGYVYDYGIVYEAKATKTLGLLQTFHVNLGEDKKNFIRLKEYTEKMNTTSFAKWNQNAKDLGATKVLIAEHHEKVSQASERMKTFLEETKYENDVISGLQLTGQIAGGIGGLANTAEEITDYFTPDDDDEDEPKSSNKPAKKKKKKRSKLSDASFGLKVVAGASTVIGSIMDIAVTAQQMKYAQKEFDEQMTGLDEIDQSTSEYKKAFKRHQELDLEQKTFQMTVSTQKIVMSKLGTLEEKITAAIHEVTTIQAIWRTVTKGIENMKKHAEIARKRVVDEDTDALSEDIEVEKQYFFTELRNMYTEWNDYVYKPLPGLCLIFGCQNDYIDVTAKDIWILISSSDKAQRWKLNGKILKNQEEAWKSDDDWEFKPQINGLIYIENTSKTKVLGSTSDGKVIEVVKGAGKAEQVWKKGEPNPEGYFTLENSGEPKVLTAFSKSSLEITDRWSTGEEKLTKAVMETIERTVNENVNQNLIPDYDEDEVDTTEVNTTEVDTTEVDTTEVDTTEVDTTEVDTPEVPIKP